MQDDPVVFPPCRGHVAKKAGAGEGGLHQMRPPGAERSPPPAHRLARRLSGATELLTARDRIGIDDVDPAEAAHARQSGLAAPVRAGNDEKRGHGRGKGSGQADSRSGCLSTRSPSLVRAI